MESPSSIKPRSDSEVARFVASMPPPYALAFAVEDAAEHVLIAGRRQGRLLHAELWQSLVNGAAVVCVVAEDRPRLLSCVLAALVERRLDVLRAEIYTRECSLGRPEVVDFFWLRALSARGGRRVIGCEEVEDFAALAVSRLRSDVATSPPEAATWLATSVAPLRAVSVAFAGAALAAGPQIVSVEAPDSPGLLLRLVRTLHRHGLEIVASEVKTDARWVRDCFTVMDPKENPLSSARREQLCAALRLAAEQLE